MAETDVIAYRPNEAARALGCGLTTLYSLIGAGRIAAKKHGNRTLIPADELRRYIASLPPADIRTGQRARAAA